MAEPLLAARGVTVRFDTPRGPLTAVRGVDLDIRPGEVVGLVGESGSGKSAFARALLRMTEPPFSAGRATVTGVARLRLGGRVLDLVAADDAAMRAVRACGVAMIFQDALSGLNPVMRVGAQLTEALRAAAPALAAAEAEARALAMLSDVGIADASAGARRYPHQLSGGQRQRVMIAIAMLRDPALLIADEPTTALDVTVQARVLDMLRDLQRRRGMAVLLISHDLGVVERFADRVAVMYAGQIVEAAPVDRLSTGLRHPYSDGLMRSRPGRRRRGEGLVGAPPDPLAPPAGCAFRPRCPRADAACAAPPPVVDGVRCIRPLA